MFKKLGLTILTVLITVGVALAVNQPSIRTTSGAIKATPGIVKGGSVSFVGVTAGDKVAEFKDSLADSGTALITVIASATADTVFLNIPASGREFATGIYLKINTSGTGTKTVIAETDFE